MLFGCCLDAARHPKDGRIRGARLTAFMGERRSTIRQGHPERSKKKRNRKKMLGKLEVLFEVPVSFRNLEFLKWNMPKTAKLKKNWMKQKGKLCFAETIHDIHEKC